MVVVRRTVVLAPGQHSRCSAKSISVIAASSASALRHQRHRCVISVSAASSASSLRHQHQRYVTSVNVTSPRSAASPTAELRHGTVCSTGAALATSRQHCSICTVLVTSSQRMQLVRRINCVGAILAASTWRPPRQTYVIYARAVFYARAVEVT